ncbi:MAG: hypothetical protein FVQ82_00565 [Planctomycetes bacterium]|nr:hypothetical protein [Planctomycetota bacterium]
MKIKIPDTGWTRLQQPQRRKHKDCTDKDLEQGAIDAYKPAYKDCKIEENSTTALPSELIEIINSWDKLPEHIKQTIQTLVGSVTARSGE